MPAEEDVDLETAFSQVAVELFGAPTVDETLRRIVQLAAETVDGCEGAGVFVVEHGAGTTVAASHPFVVELDRAQIDAGEGPCIDAAERATTVYAADLADDARWPGFSPTAVRAGVRSVVAYSLSPNRPSALNLYAHLPAAFGATDRAQGLLFATLARLALDSAEERAADERRAGNLAEALRTREIIGQAQGILMERERITADQAFDVLRRASQRMNVKLRDVARDLVETGESEPPPPPVR